MYRKLTRLFVGKDVIGLKRDFFLQKSMPSSNRFIFTVVLSPDLSRFKPMPNSKMPSPSNAAIPFFAIPTLSPAAFGSATSLRVTAPLLPALAHAFATIGRAPPRALVCQSGQLPVLAPSPTPQPPPTHTPP